MYMISFLSPQLLEVFGFRQTAIALGSWLKAHVKLQECIPVLAEPVLSLVGFGIVIRKCEVVQQ